MVAEPRLPQRMKVGARGRLKGCGREDMVEAAAYENPLTLQVPTELLALVTVQGSEDVSEIKAGESAQDISLAGIPALAGATTTATPYRYLAVVEDVLAPCDAVAVSSLKLWSVEV